MAAGPSFEGTVRCEAIVQDVAACYGRTVEVTFLADAALLTLGTQTLSYAREPGLPPSYVLDLGAFSVLTPGSHGLRGLESWVGGHPIQGLGGVTDMVGLLVAIAVGMLVAAAAAGPGRRIHSAED